MKRDSLPKINPHIKRPVFLIIKILGIYTGMEDQKGKEKRED